MGLRLPLAAISTTHHAANLLRWCVSGSHSAAPLLFVYCCLLVVLLPVVHQPASLITALLVLRPSCSVGCCISQCFSLFLLSCLRPVPWPLPFIMPQPFIAPVLFSWLSCCSEPQPPSRRNSAWCRGLRLLLVPCSSAATPAAVSIQCDVTFPRAGGPQTLPFPLPLQCASVASMGLS